MITLDNFLRSGFTFKEEEYELRSRYALINSVLSIGGLLVLGLTILLFFDGEFFYAIANSIFLLLCLYFIYLLRKTRTACRIVVPFFLFAGLFLVTIALIRFPEEDVRIAWFLLIILLSFFLGGSRIGIVVSLTSIIIVFIVKEYVNVQTDYYLTVLAITIIFLGAIFSNLYENRTKRAKKILLNLNKNLEDKVEERTKEIEEQYASFETLFEKSSDARSVLDNGIFVQHNVKAVEMLGYHSKEELLNLHPSELSPEFQPDGQSSYKKALEMIHLAEKKGGHRFEWVHTRANGEDFWSEVVLTPIVLNNRHVLYVTWRDISEQKNIREELIEQKNILHHQAHHDNLTDLPNRVYFNDELQKTIEESQQNQTEFALFFIDLDQFKHINDSLGHEIGDKILQAVTQRLMAKIRKKDLLARLGGDEFTIIMNKLVNAQDATKLAQKILDVLKQPIHIEGHTLYVTSSIGISLYPQDGTDAHNLLKYADTAMYKAKDMGRNNFQFYSAEMTELAFEKIVMEASLRQAIKNREFVVYFQPQVDALTENIFGLEALVRWEHPVMGLVTPEKFISLAEEKSLIVEIDTLVMQSAMKQISQWYAEGLFPGVLSLNISIQWLERESFFQTVQENINKFRFKPEWLGLEITESEVMKNPVDCITKLQQLNEFGIKLSIDDFGTGYSSLSYLKRLPIHTLKIDQSFIRDIPDDDEDTAIVKAIIALSESLNLGIIAEGVETSEQKDFLLEHGCKDIQGYYYGRPMPAEEIFSTYLSTDSSTN